MAFRTQKISQMTPKGADLEATDLIEVSTIESGSYVTRSITGQELIDAIPLPPTGLTVGTTPISSGTVGRILFEGTGNVVQESANLFWDNTNGRLGIGGTPSTNTLDIQSSSGFPKTLLAFRRPTLGDWGLSLGNEAISNLYIGAVDVPANITSRYFWRANYNTAGVAANTFRPIDAALTTVPVVEIQGVLSTTAQYFSITSSGSTMGNLFNVKSTGNVLINTTTDAGFRLDVNGTARVQGTTTISKSGSNNYFTFEPSATGTAPFLQAFFQGQTDHRMYFNSGSVAFRNAGTVLKSNIDCGNITAEGTAYLTGAADQSIWLGGSTNNYLRFTDAGVIHIGLIGTADATSYIQVRTGGATNMSTGTLSTAFFSTGNVGINTTTDAGFRLDVNGTARFQSDVTVANSLMKMYVTGGVIRFEQQGGAGFPIAFMQNGSFYQYIDQATLNIAFRNDYSFVMTTGNNSTINASAKMQIDSTTKGFLPPRMTTTQKNAIATPAAGLMVYDTTLNVISYYNGTMWI